MNNIIYDEKIIFPKTDFWKYYDNVIPKLDEKDYAKVLLFCSKITYYLVLNKNKIFVKNCIAELVEYIKNNNFILSKNKYDYYTNIDWEDDIASYPASWSINLIYFNNNLLPFRYVAEGVKCAIYILDYEKDKINIENINLYLQILLRKTNQFNIEVHNNTNYEKVLKEIINFDIDKLELVDWNMLCDIISEEYNIIHEFKYEDFFNRRCFIELLRKEFFKD